MDAVSVPLDVRELATRLVLAAALGAIIGANRERFFKPAGLRTHALVSMGAALITLVGMFLTAAPRPDPSAPARIIQGIVAGVGFIGGGVILHLKDIQTIRGLTTATTIWIVAATGIAVGAGLWRAATIAVVLAIFVLTSGRPLERLARWGSDGQDD